VIDYKTGSQPSMKTKTVEEIFSTKDISKRHSDYFLQAILYSLIVSRSAEWNAHGLNVSPALLFIRQSAKEGYDPTMSLGDERITDVEKYANEFTELLKLTLANIFEPTLPFSPTDEKSHCSTCPYKQICEL